MRRSNGLIKALIHFHWKSIVRDNAHIDAIEMERRMKVIKNLKARMAQREQYKK
jgi:hypothetical protein